jgi:hypothetical protein
LEIEIERSGGFAKIIKRVTIDTKKRPKDFTRNLEKHLLDAKREYRSSKTARSKIADCFYYAISVREEISDKKLTLRNLNLIKGTRHN